MEVMSYILFILLILLKTGGTETYRVSSCSGISMIVNESPRVSGVVCVPFDGDVL